MEKSVDNERYLWKNNLNFVKYMSVLYIHFIITVITVSEQNRRHHFCTTSRITVVS